MKDISWIHLVILILAAFRLTHLLVYDEIASFIRKPFMDVRSLQNADGKMIDQVEIKGKGLRRFIGSLLSCYWCTGVWCSMLVVLLYWLVPFTFPVLVILAVAGAAAFIESRV